MAREGERPRSSLLVASETNASASGEAGGRIVLSLRAWSLISAQSEAAWAPRGDSDGTIQLAWQLAPWRLTTWHLRCPLCARR